VPDITGRVHHVNVSVSDIEASARWYEELFGLHELARIDDPDGAWTKVILRHDSGLLVGFTQHARNDGVPFEEWRCGTDHIALDVGTLEQLHSWLGRLDELGVTRSEIKTTSLGALITIRDPDNVQLELYAAHTG